MSQYLLNKLNRKLDYKKALLNEVSLELYQSLIHYRNVMNYVDLSSEFDRSDALFIVTSLSKKVVAIKKSIRKIRFKIRFHSII